MLNLKALKKQGVSCWVKQVQGTMAAQSASLAEVRPAETKPNKGYL